MALIKLINIFMLVIVLINAFILVTVRYSTRLNYNDFTEKQKMADILNKEYTKLQLEVGTYSSSLVLEDFAYSKLGLIKPDQKHIVEVK